MGATMLSRRAGFGALVGAGEMAHLLGVTRGWFEVHADRIGVPSRPGYLGAMYCVAEVDHWLETADLSSLRRVAA